MQNIIIQIFCLLAIDYSLARLTMMQNVAGRRVLPDIAQPRGDGDGERVFEMPPSLPNALLLLPCTPCTTFTAMSLRLCMDLTCKNNEFKNIVDIISNMPYNGPLS